MTKNRRYLIEITYLIVILLIILVHPKVRHTLFDSKFNPETSVCTKENTPLYGCADNTASITYDGFGSDVLKISEWQPKKEYCDEIFSSSDPISKDVVESCIYALAEGKKKSLKELIETLNQTKEMESPVFIVPYNVTWLMNGVIIS